jgi:amidophosphoribosyltransferase
MQFKTRMWYCINQALRKPLEFYKEKYGSAFYGVNKMYLMMEKQHNRGQDGAGFASIKLDTASR